MIIVKLWGGLGNQMFQYAFAKYLSVKHDTKLKADVTLLNKKISQRKTFVVRNFDLDIFNLSIDVASAEELNKFRWSQHELTNKVLNKFFGKKKGYVLEPHFHFSHGCFAASNNSYLDGYWQSKKYFSEIDKILREKDFSFKEEIGAEAKTILDLIDNSMAVCVNVRRGDFVTNPFHGTCSSAYFKEAAEITEKKVPNPHYFVFSDDIDWCEKNLSFNHRTTFVNHIYAGKKFQDYLRLMSACKNFIIPNSSFAWWAVWLCNNPEKLVIAPANWFRDKKINTSDLVPGEWIRI